MTDFMHHTQDQESTIQQLVLSIESQDEQRVIRQLKVLPATDISEIIAVLIPAHRSVLWKLLSEEQHGEILPLLREGVRASVLGEMEAEQLIQAAVTIDIDDLADVISEFPEEVSDSILETLEKDRRKRLESVLSLEEGTAGRLMRTETLSVREDVDFSVVLRWLRRHDKLPPFTDSIMVIDENGVYQGKLELADVITGHPDTLVKDAMIGEEQAILHSMPEHDVALLFEKQSLISIPVIGENRELLGRITIDDAVSVIRQEGEQALLKSGGVAAEEDLFSPVIPSAKRRGIWLGVNLLTVFVAVWVIGLFEDALEQVVALAVLMPVTASMGGIAGSQTLTLTIRGLTLNQIAPNNIPWLIRKELAIGALNGLVWAVFVALISGLWFKDLTLAGIIAIALFITFLAAAFSGMVVPLVLKRLGIDPALSGAVILTTITDVIGFLSFLGLASIFLLSA